MNYIQQRKRDRKTENESYRVIMNYIQQRKRDRKAEKERYREIKDGWYCDHGGGDGLAKNFQAWVRERRNKRGREMDRERGTKTGTERDKQRERNNEKIRKKRNCPTDATFAVEQKFNYTNSFFFPTS